MMSGLVTSLNETRAAYYERYRLADIFAPVARAPERLLPRLAAIDGVGTVEGRVTGSALIDLDGADLPVQAQVASLPDLREPRLNAVYLSEGRMIDSDNSDEILLLQSFADAHGLQPGDRSSATMNGARHNFQIIGLAQSPEFLYTTAPGEMVPDDARFGVMWMNNSTLAAAYDMQGVFNEVLLSLSRHARNVDSAHTTRDRAAAQLESAEEALPASEVLANTVPLVMVAIVTLGFATWIVRRRLLDPNPA